MGLRELLAKRTAIPGILTVVSGPSGAGKGTVIRALIEKHPNLALSVSMTTRPPREGERDGADYYFRTRKEFEETIERGGFLEWAEFCGNYYGTPKKPVERQLTAGFDVILEIDIQGGLSVKRHFPDATYIFLLPPSWKALRRRLQKRGSETPESLQRRLAAAQGELEHVRNYRFAVVNDEIESCAHDIATIIAAARHRRGPLQSLIDTMDWDTILGSA